MNSKFKQLPVLIKLVVIWFLLLGISSFWRFGSDIVGHVLDIGSLISGFISWGLAVGLTNRSNESRWWAAFFAILGSLGALFLLAVMLYENPDPVMGFHIQTLAPQDQAIVFLLIFLVLNVGTLFALLNPANKTFFVLQNDQEDKQ